MLTNAIAWLEDPSGLTAHGFCLQWDPWLLWIHGLSDAAIGLAYFTIPLALAIFVRRRPDVSYRPVVWLFVAFIVLCGTGHWFDLLTLWVPAYGVEGLIKAANAIVSVLTAIALWRLLPRAVALPSPDQLRAANAALRESEARHRAMFEQSPVPLHTLDGDGVITCVSNSWLNLMGYNQSEVIGRKLNDFSAPGSNAWMDSDHRRLMQDGEALDMERLFVRRDGQVIIGLLSARLERRDGDNWIVCVLNDITARRDAEEALKISEERLRHAQKMEAVGQLTGGIAHDFNNMLQGVAAGLDVMERRIAQGRADEAGHYIAIARQSVTRAAGLTFRMLAFARRQALLPTAIEPSTLVRGMEELIRRTLGPGIDLKLRLYEGIWPALCDANQLESALLNLAINARDAMPGGGTLTIGTANRHLAAGDLSLTEDAEPGDYIELSVTDTGVGMAQATLERAFEPFFTTKPLGRGTGLGLSQIYGFVRQSGGLVRLASEPGRGATALLFLPRARQSTPNRVILPEGLDAPNSTPDMAGLQGRVVLVVEDEDSIRDLVAESLVYLGCTVLQAADGPSGLHVIQSQQVLDLVITDVGLPGLNGRQLADAARACRPGLRVLITTGYAGHALDDLELAAGMEVLRKPFSLDALGQRVAAMLQATIIA